MAIFKKSRTYIDMTVKKVLTCLFLFLAYSASGQMPNTLTASEKVYGLSKFWQEVNYNFIYFNKVDHKKWDSTYSSLIEEVQKTSNDYEYFRLMKKFCAMLKDGHTNIYFPEKIQSQLSKTMFGEYRIFIENIDHKAIITRVNLSKKNILPIGSEIISVNEYPTREYLAKFVSPYISSSTSHILEDISISEMLQGFEGEQYKLKIKKPDGEIFGLTIIHSKCSETELYPDTKESTNLIDFKWYENQIAYIALNSFENKSIDSLFVNKLPELYKAKALIIDLRKNGGGNGDYGLEILKYLIPDTIIYGSKSRTRNHISTYKAWGEMTNPKDTAIHPEYKKAYLNYIGEYYYEFSNTPRSLQTSFKRLLIPTAVLIGHYTASAAEDFLIYADKQPHFIKLGSPTFGSTGQPFHFTLPGGALARICTKQDTYSDGREFVGYGIRPDIEVISTVSDFLNKKDQVLGKAIEYLKQNPK